MAAQMPGQMYGKIAVKKEPDTSPIGNVFGSFLFTSYSKDTIPLELSS